MTQHELAKATGMPQPSIARIERGTVIPRTTTLIEILDATGHRLEVDVRDPALDLAPIRARLAASVPRRTRDALGGQAKLKRQNPIQIVRRLRRFGVPFVLIGELAEVAHGRPASIGRVVEICIADTAEAADRLRMTLEEIGATSTDGLLRVMNETPAGDDYEVLRRNAVALHLDAGMVASVASVEDLIRIREAGHSPEDREIAAVLRAIERAS